MNGEALSIQQFGNYLNDKGFSEKTQAQYQRSIAIFLEYTGEPAENISNNQVLEYVGFLQKQGRSAPYINAELNRLRHYFSYQIELGKLAINPAKGLKVRGSKRKLLHNLLTKEELEELYNRYEGTLEYKTVLSLLIYQGLHASDFPTLEKHHFALEKAKIHLPGSAKTQARTLNLEAAQILLLHQYIASKPDNKDLFRKPSSLHNQISYLIKALKKINPAVKNSLQIRASVIRNWLKSEDLRIVQYKAGHRYVSSTERYQSQELEQLQADLEKYHPR